MAACLKSPQSNGEPAALRGKYCFCRSIGGIGNRPTQSIGLGSLDEAQGSVARVELAYKPTDLATPVQEIAGCFNSLADRASSAQQYKASHSDPLDLRTKCDL